ncbi:MAG: aldehyde dehydrogenase family protein [Planctomycetota bacterium]
MRDVLARLLLEPMNSGACGKSWLATGGDVLDSSNPATGGILGQVKLAVAADYERVMAETAQAFDAWRSWPAPRRGEVVRQLAQAFREHKEDLATLISLEMGKIYAEALGEVQEMIDIADFAVGLSRQLCGNTMHSERPMHRMYEQWHPLGVVGIITAFNFPGAVWSWNAMIAAVCGDTMIWKPSHKVPLTAVAIQHLVHGVLQRNDCAGVMSLLIGHTDIGERLVRDRRVPLISATGSCRMGRHIGAALAERFARGLLELGGNNAVVVMDDANLDLALRAVLFGAVGTAGQRCTTTRRLLLQKGIAREFTLRLKAAYEQVRIGDPLAADTLMGPLIDEHAVGDMMAALERIEREGGEILHGGKRLTEGRYAKGCYVMPTLVKARPTMEVVKDETFAPILYILEVADIAEAVRLNNAVPQGLSSSIFTNDLRAAEEFLSHRGSDCGIANVNIGTSGAEIGGAFGGEKDTGGGREAGSDCWKAYMRRQTNTINWSSSLPLAQGIRFGS